MTPQQIDTTIYNQAKSMGIADTQAKLIVAQARYETNNYKSPVFNKYNNAFGYKWVGQKKWATGQGGAASSHDAQGNPDGGSYAAYPSVAYSTGEIVDWLKRRQAEKKFVIANLTTPQQYATALKSAGYYGQTASEYGNGLMNTLKNVAIIASGGLGILALIATFFF